MKEIGIFLTLIFSLTTCAHGQTYLDSNRLTLSVDIEAQSVDVHNNPAHIDSRVLDKFSAELESIQSSKPNSLLSSIEEELELELFNAIPDGSLYLRFMDNDNMHVVTLVADELIAFTSHNHDDVPSEQANFDERYFSVKVPEGLGIDKAEIFFKDNAQENFLSVILIQSLAVNAKENSLIANF